MKINTVLALGGIGALASYFLSSSASAATSFGNSDVTLSVALSTAPNTSSPSHAGWQANVTSFYLGNPYDSNQSSNPSAYNQTGAVTYAGAAITSTFNSWQGQASPSGAFASETGGRIHATWMAVAANASITVRLTDISYTRDSDDSNNGFDGGGSYTGVNYSASTFGILYGTDGMFGGGDDTYITSGAGTLFVNAIVSSGPAVAFGAGPTGTDQERLDATLGYYEDEGGINLDYEFTLATYDGGTASGPLSVTDSTLLAVPEPSVALLGGIGLLGLLRRKRARG